MSKRKKKQALNKDYVIEDGQLVMTRQYHLKRGYCCGNGCRYCPYEQQKTTNGFKKDQLHR